MLYLRSVMMQESMAMCSSTASVKWGDVDRCTVECVRLEKR